MKFKTNFSKAISLSFFLSFFLSLTTSAQTPTPWLLGGNNAVVSGDFMGTINSAPLEIRTNDIPALTISEVNQNISINTPGFGAKLNVLENNGITGLHVRNSSSNPFGTIGMLSEIGFGATGQTLSGMVSSVQSTNIGYGSFNLVIPTPTSVESYGVFAEVSTNPNLNDLAYAIWGRVNQNAGPSTSYAGFFEGKTWCTSGSWTGSDAFLKDDINDLSSNLEIINLLQPKKYRFQQEAYPQLSLPSGYHFGFIAQELEEVLPELVGTAVHPAEYDDEGNMIAEAIEMKGVNYDGLIPILTGAIQELEARLVEMEARLEGCCSNKNASENETPSSIKEDSSFKLFPNPSSGLVKLAIKSQEKSHVRIVVINEQGQEAEKFESIPLTEGENLVDLDLSFLNAGKYFVQMIHNQKTETQILIIQ
jgi:hypothetical protein